MSAGASASTLWSCLDQCGEAAMPMASMGSGEMAMRRLTAMSTMCPPPTVGIQVALITGFSASVAASLSREPPMGGASEMGTPTSGSLFHPAVVVAFCLRGKLTVMRALSYLAFQIVGALVGGALLLGVLGDGCFSQSFTMAGFSHGGVSKGSCVLNDAILSMMLSLVYLWTSERLKFMPSPIIVGFAYISATMQGYPKTGSVFNPLRDFGVAAFVGDAVAWKWAPWVGALVGGGLAALLDILLYSPRLWDRYGAASKVHDESRSNAYVTSTEGQQTRDAA